jgi:hypothetical protein
MISVKQLYVAHDLISGLILLNESKQQVVSAAVCGPDRKVSVYCRNSDTEGRIRVNATNLLKLIEDEIAELKEKLLALGVDADADN